MKKTTLKAALQVLFMLFISGYGYAQNVSFAKAKPHLPNIGKPVSPEHGSATSKAIGENVQHIDSLNRNLKLFVDQLRASNINITVPKMTVKDQKTSLDTSAIKTILDSVMRTRNMPMMGIVSSIKSNIDTIDSYFAKLDSLNKAGHKRYTTPNERNRQMVRQEIADLKKRFKEFKDSIRLDTYDSVLSFDSLYSRYIIDTLTAHIDTAISNENGEIELQKEILFATKIGLRESMNNRHLFPASYSNEAISFYTEKDTLVSKFFSDNSLIYNNSQQKLAYGSEAYCDYFGPVRVGIGYTITSAANTTNDTVKNRSDAVQQIITSGGNINYSLSYPLLVVMVGDHLEIKANFAHKGGVYIPKDSAAASTYGFLTSTGMNVNIFSQGFNNVISLFGTARIAYVLGDRNYQKYLDENSFWLAQVSFGIAIKDNFRIRFDQYFGLSGMENQKFVNSNFPMTVSFDIVNPFGQ